MWSVELEVFRPASPVVGQKQSKSQWLSAEANVGVNLTCVKLGKGQGAGESGGDC